MQVTVKKLPKSRVELHIEVPADTMAEFFAHAYQELASQVDIPGFRRGKAPKAIVLKRVGSERILASAIDHALPKTYHQAVVKEELIPVTEPTIHVKSAGEDEPFIYDVEVDVVPDVETGNYRNVRVNQKKFEAKKVEQAAIDEALLRVRKAFATTKPVERAAQTGDWVELSYQGKIDGVVQTGLESKNQPLILGEKVLIPEFETQLLGMQAGDNRTFTIDVPMDRGKKQTVEFTATIHQVAEVEIPELTDELAKKFGKKSAADVRETIEAELKADADHEAKLAYETAVLEAVVKLARTELPESLIEREIDNRIEVLTEQLSRSGQTLKHFLEHKNKTIEDFRKEIRPAAEEAVKTGLVLRAIADNEGFTAEGDNASQEIFKQVVELLVDSARK